MPVILRHPRAQAQLAQPARRTAPMRLTFDHGLRWRLRLLWWWNNGLRHHRRHLYLYRHGNRCQHRENHGKYNRNRNSNVIDPSPPVVIGLETSMEGLRLNAGRRRGQCKAAHCRNRLPPNQTPRSYCRSKESAGPGATVPRAKAQCAPGRAPAPPDPPPGHDAKSAPHPAR